MPTQIQPEGSAYRILSSRRHPFGAGQNRTVSRTICRKKVQPASSPATDKRAGKARRGRTGVQHPTAATDKLAGKARADRRSTRHRRNRQAGGQGAGGRSAATDKRAGKARADRRSTPHRRNRQAGGQGAARSDRLTVRRNNKTDGRGAGGPAFNTPPPQQTSGRARRGAVGPADGPPQQQN